MKSFEQVVEVPGAKCPACGHDRFRRGQKGAIRCLSCPATMDVTTVLDKNGTFVLRVKTDMVLIGALDPWRALSFLMSPQAYKPLASYLEALEYSAQELTSACEVQAAWPHIWKEVKGLGPVRLAEIDRALQDLGVAVPRRD